MDSLSTLITKIKNSDHELWLSEPANEESIQKLETKLGKKLPVEYRTFLSNFGALGLGGTFYSGILDSSPLLMEGGNVFADTKFVREDYVTFPDDYLVICVHEDGAYCMKLDSENPKVENFENGNLSKVADSFNEFMTNSLKFWV